MKRLGDTEKVVSWKSKGFSIKKLLPLIIIVFLHQLNGTKIQILFNILRKLLKKATFTPPNIIIFFIAYEIDAWLRELNSDFTLKNCLFASVS